MGKPVTGFQNAAVYGGVAFAISFIALKQLGFELGTILTTSALATAALGFAMQPTLSSMIAGFAVNSDRELHIGDTVMLEGRAIRITALSWRAAKGRTADGAVVVIPNTKLSDGIMEIVPDGEPQRFDFPFAGPAAMPGMVCKLAADVATTIAGVDAGRSLDAIADTVAQDGSGSYLLRIWLKPPYDRVAFKGTFQQRFWHVCRRNGLVQADDVLRKQIAQTTSGFGLDGQAGAALAEVRLLTYATGELLKLPPTLAGARTFLVEGCAVAGDSALARPLTLQGLAAVLADTIGPYAHFAVRRAAATAPSYGALCDVLAQEIDVPLDRQHFLSLAGGGGRQIFKPGEWLDMNMHLYADGETAILTVPFHAAGSPK